jgi:hypothetical protein
LLAIVLLLGCARPEPTEALPQGSASGDCASCHASHFEEHAGSAHARSSESPVLAALLPEVHAAWGEVSHDLCVGCHAPEHSPDPGIGCVSCHAAVGNHATRDGMLAVDTSVPLSGPFDDAAPTSAHHSRQDGFLSSPALCGTCHELTGPNLVDEPTLTEFERSPQAAAGMTCIDCHMPEQGEAPIVEGGRARPVRSHRFVGFDPPWGASAEGAALAAERTRALLAAALSLTIEPSEGGVDVVVRNVGAGHSVPTGATFLRDLWVDVEVGGVVAERVIVLRDQPMREGVPVPLLTQADSVEAGSLAAGAERRARIEVPAGASITARLYGRAVSEQVVEALGLEARAAEIPTHEIAIVSAAL